MTNKPAATPQESANGAPPLIKSTAIPGHEEVSVGTVVRTFPAWVVSVVFHAVLLALFLFVTASGTGAVETENEIFETKIEDAPEDANLTNDDLGIDPDLPTNYDMDRIEDVSVPGPVDVDAAVGLENAPQGPPQTLPPPPGTGRGQGAGLDIAGVTGTANPFGTVGGFNGLKMIPGGFAGRSGATRQKMLNEGGGNTETEAAVASGLKWLALHQAPDGHWELDGFHRVARDKYGPGSRVFTCNCEGRGTKNDTAATGFGLLPFLAAGETHRPPTTRGTIHYNKTVELGLKYLMTKQGRDGNYGGGMYSHPLATIAMCEAYGLTSDPLLKQSAQRAIDYMVRAQHNGGGWRYSPGQPGDVSVTGWVVMALKSGQMSGLNVPSATLKGAEKFLDACMTSDGQYGYTDAAPNRPATTAVGLLCRQYLGWSPRNLNLINGVGHIKKDGRLPGQLRSIYYLYYATQVMHHMGGEEWQTWNPKMKQFLLSTQDKGNNPKFPHQKGSWSPTGDPHGGAGGRVMLTSLSTLTLEVYYRHLPLYRRDMGGMKGMGDKE